ncbi:hypothetical protein ACFLQL_00335 [Verrucomicrobiota bacterium]
MIIKNAKIPWSGIAQALGLAGGAGVGLEITPRLGGYMEEKPARWASTIANAVIGQTVAKALTSSPRKWPSALVMLGLGAGELAPVGISSMMKRVKATEGSSIPRFLKEISNTNTGKGVGIGAALAGIGGTASGLFRAKSEREEEAKHTRTDMIKRDILLAMLPAMVAGGVGGSLINSKTD